MSVKPNENFISLKKNYLFAEIASRLSAYKAKNPDKDVITLGVGDVTLPLAPTVVAAMEKAAAEMGNAETFRGYPPYFGYDFLRAAISENYRRRGVFIEQDEIFVSDGAKSDAANITEIFGASPVILADPVYPVYMDSAIIGGRDVFLIPSKKENGFLPSPSRLHTDGAIVYLCSPNNPTGAVYDREKLREWVDFARNSGSVIIFDAAYESFVTGDLPRSVFEIDGAEECAVEICSFSKSAGFTGVRCSWTVVPKKLSAGGASLWELWARRQSTKFNGVSYMIQRGAEAALSENGRRECEKMTAYYMSNAHLLSEMLTEKGIFFTGGKNAPYIWLECPKSMTSWEFFDFLLDRAQVVGTPGAGFGTHGEGYFRLTAFASRSDTEEAVRRIRSVI